MMRDVERVVSRAMNAVRSPFRAVLTALNLTPAVQLAQADAMAGEQLQDAELFQHYGFTSAPKAGAAMIVLPIGGKTAHGIVIATEHGQFRMKLNAAGEVAIYSDEGDYVWLKRGRIAEINTDTLVVKATTKVRLETPLVETTGKIEAESTILDLRGSNTRKVSDMRSQYNGHSHVPGPGPDSGHLM